MTTAEMRALLNEIIADLDTPYRDEPSARADIRVLTNMLGPLLDRVIALERQRPIAPQPSSPPASGTMMRGG